jgi:uncharacterized protein YdiU (UPF0061 family)
MGRKLGLAGPEEPDQALIGSLLSLLAAHRVDYTVFFRRLCAVADGADIGELVGSFGKGEGAIREWVSGWRRRIATEPMSSGERASSMRRANPALIPRNHRVEEALSAAVRESSFEPFETLVRALANPFDERPEHGHLAEAPGREQREYVTFCGT